MGEGVRKKHMSILGGVFLFCGKQHCGGKSVDLESGLDLHLDFIRS